MIFSLFTVKAGKMRGKLNAIALSNNFDFWRILDHF
jgi:hypothetical protein